MLSVKGRKSKSKWENSPSSGERDSATSSVAVAWKKKKKEKMVFRDRPWQHRWLNVSWWRFVLPLWGRGCWRALCVVEHQTSQRAFLRLPPGWVRTETWGCCQRQRTGCWTHLTSIWISLCDAEPADDFTCLATCWLFLSANYRHLDVLGSWAVCCRLPDRLRSWFHHIEEPTGWPETPIGDRSELPAERWVRIPEEPSQCSSETQTDVQNRGKEKKITQPLRCKILIFF